MILKSLRFWRGGWRCCKYSYGFTHVYVYKEASGQQRLSFSLSCLTVHLVLWSRISQLNLELHNSGTSCSKLLGPSESRCWNYAVAYVTALVYFTVVLKPWALPSNLSLQPQVAPFSKEKTWQHLRNGDSHQSRPGRQTSVRFISFLQRKILLYLFLY